MPDKFINNDETYNIRGGGMTSNLSYLLAGAGIGATLALLFAPKSGRELRGDISEITRKGYDETLELAHELKDRSADLYQSLKESADRVYDVAATRLNLAERTLEDAGNTLSGPVNGEIGRKSTGSQKQTDLPPTTF
jgi:gas vesicle protein